ncbi:hypothetical protein PRIPAC_91964 [Pristionchus pacificus]|uniref:histone acetyltransferase n=1 Tax=Pristionchus pacificus TaxID=54126 RepID=A0A454Y6A8_PRIPA|nr:hypothetical protein PRIPAC_91964 [Pristionchus pacificus]|eukprot:PDM62686.1 hypothetical protein PRIPAC_49901 [Pristionchus pacificus]
MDSDSNQILALFASFHIDSPSELDKWLQIMEHAVPCRLKNGRCETEGCGEMRRALVHLMDCEQRISCPLCKQLFALFCHHSKRCKEERCEVPLCVHIRKQEITASPQMIGQN